MNQAVLLLMVAVLFGCSHRKNNKESVDLQEAAARESLDLSNQSVVSEDNDLHFQVKGRSAPVTKTIRDQVNYYHYTSIDIGAAAPMECFFYKQEINPAAALKNISERILADKKSVGNVTAKQTSMFGAGAIEGHPFLLLQTGFNVQVEGQNLVGNLKAMVASKEVGSVLCYHNEVGYQKTFSENFVEIVKTYQFTKTPIPTILYKDVLLLTINDMPIGYIAKYVTEGQNQSKALVQKTSLLMSESPTKIHSMDDVDLEVSNREGVVIYGIYKSQADDKLLYGIEISTKDGKSYLVKGTKEDTKIDKVMQTYEGIVSSYKHTKMLPQKLFEQNLQFFSIPVYLPGKNPYAPVRMRTSLKKKNKSGAIVRLDDGESSHVTVISKDGVTEAVRIPAGNVEIEGKKIFSSGTFGKD